jgi:hypothetical protein
LTTGRKHQQASDDCSDQKLAETAPTAAGSTASGKTGQTSFERVPGFFSDRDPPTQIGGFI